MSFMAGLATGVADAKLMHDRRKEREAERAQSGGQEASSNNRNRRQLPSQYDAGAASTGAPTPAQTGPFSERVRKAYDKFVGAGLSPEVSAGLVGNLMQESGRDIDPAAVGDNGNAFGAPQFNGPRMRAYKAFAAERGVDPADFDAQLDYILHEGQTTEKGAWGAISKATTAEEAARIASNKFWRPGTPHLSNRESYASAVYNAFANQQASQPASQPARRDLTTGKPKPQLWGWVDNVRQNLRGL